MITPCKNLELILIFILAVFVKLTAQEFMFFRQDECLDKACDQVHDYLAAIAHKRSSELSKVISILSCLLKKGTFW